MHATCHRQVTQGHIGFVNRLKINALKAHADDSHRSPMNHLLHFSKLWTIYLSFYVHSNHRCGMHMKMFFMLFDLAVLPLLLPPWVCSFLFLHVSTLWFIIPQFVQYFFIFPILLCVFVDATCLVFYGIESALLASIIVMFSSHNIVASLCCCNVDCFIPIVAILKYDYILALNIIVRKCLWLVLVNHELTFKSVHNKLPPF